MIKQIVFSVFILVIGILCFNTKGKTSNIGAQAGYTAAPGDISSCVICHNSFPVNSGTAIPSISGISNYTPNSTYSITVSLSNNQILRNGFEIIVLKDIDDTETGTLVLTDAINTKLVTGGTPAGTRTYVTHTLTGTALSSWTFDWTAPATDVGSVTFYASLNDADNSFTFLGDYIYTTSLSVSTCSTININESVTDVSCNGDGDGAIDIALVGGTPPISYAWSNGATTEDLSGLNGGVYTVTVTDNNNCSATLSLVVSEPQVLGASITLVTDVTCNGDANGAIDIALAGGTPPISYSWSNGATTQDLSGLGGGVYSVTVTDNNSCSATLLSLVVNEPPALGATITLVTDVTCNGDGDGAIDIALAGGGTPPISYAWSNGATTQDLSGIDGGVYTVTVTDNSNCSATLSLVVNEPPAIDATITPVGGSTAFCPNPGVGVLFQSVINPNVTKQWYKFANLLVGETGDTYLADKASGYKLLVTDGNGCSKFGPTVLTTKLPLPPSTITVIGNTSFCGGDSAVLMANSGPYTYGWLRYGRVQNGQTSQTYAALRGGRYKATVTDTNGCFKNSALLILTKWPNPKSNVTPTTAQLPSPICFGDSTLLTGIPSFGTPPYTYQWYRYNSVLAGQTNLTYTATQGGGYSIRVVDVNGCARKSARTVITTTCRYGSNEYALTNNLNLVAFPNPFRNEVTLVLDNFSDEKVKIIVRDAIGKVVYESLESAEFDYKINTESYPPGIYIVDVVQGNNMKRIKIFK